MLIAIKTMHRLNLAHLMHMSEILDRTLEFLHTEDNKKAAKLTRPPSLHSCTLGTGTIISVC